MTSKEHNSIVDSVTETAKRVKNKTKLKRNGNIYTNFECLGGNLLRNKNPLRIALESNSFFYLNGPKNATSFF